MQAKDGVTLYSTRLFFKPILLNCVAELRTGGSLGTINEKLNISSAQSVSGLYLLGNVPNNGTIQSVCAFGKVNTLNSSLDSGVTVGTIVIYVIRPNRILNNEFRVQLTQDNNCLLRECNQDFDIRVESSDYIVVYIPNICILAEDAIQCPLQVNFQNETSSTGYYEDSDELSADDFAPGQRKVNKIVSDQQPVAVDTFLNVQVIFKGIKIIHL